MQNDIEIKQHSIQEKIETLERLGLNEELSSAMPLITDESIKDIIERHDDRCSYNACPINFLTYGLDEKGRLIQFRDHLPGDPSRHCTLNRKTRELIYSKLPPVLQALLPNKALSDYEIAEDKKIAAMSPEEREAYLKAKEEKFKKYLESVQQSPKPKEVSLNSA